jgi:hypothetical protein
VHPPLAQTAARPAAAAPRNISKNHDVFLLVGGNLGKNVYKLGPAKFGDSAFADRLDSLLEKEVPTGAMLGSSRIFSYEEENIQVIVIVKKNEDDTYYLKLILNKESDANMNLETKNKIIKSFLKQKLNIDT